MALPLARATQGAPLVLIPQHFGSLVFDRRTSRYLPFDREVTTFLRQLAVTPLDDLLASVDDDTQRGSLIHFVERFYSHGFFTVDLRFAGDILDLAPPADHLAGPLAVHLEVVAACNLRCVHCFAGELPRKETALTLDELDALFADMAAMGSYRLGLTGGEPLLRHDIFDIIDRALAHGLHPCITTNGLQITEEIARAFGRREMVWLNVSLEGATAATNDAVRGSGTFERVLERLAILRQYASFTLAFTIMRSNVHEIQACVDLAAQVGAETAVFRPLYPVGVARSHLELMPTFEEYTDALDTLVGLADTHADGVRVLDPFSPQLRAVTQGKSYANLGCGAGNTVCSISVSGDVNPCSFLGPACVAANVREQPLSMIWRSSEGFQRMRALPGARSSPDAAPAFGGGCRARSLVFNGSINAPDPWVTAQRENAGANARRRWQPLTVLEVTHTAR
jgi:radical SAM protein with 4Fe4S-binding SPASM domain